VRGGGEEGGECDGMMMRGGVWVISRGGVKMSRDMLNST